MRNTSSTFGVYLRKEEIDSYSLEELRALFQIARMLNVLRFHLLERVLIKHDCNKLFDHRNQTEILLNLATTLRESTKLFFRDIDPIISTKYVNESVAVKYSALKNRIENRKNDSFYRVAGFIRDNIGSHFKENLFDGIISEEGETKEDVLLGISVDNSIRGFLLIEPYTIIFMNIAKMLPKNVESENVYNWLEEQTYYETNIFTELLDQVLIEILKGKGYLKPIPIEILKNWDNSREKT